MALWKTTKQSKPLAARSLWSVARYLLANKAYRRVLIRFVAVQLMTRPRAVYTAYRAIARLTR